jgi:16S rRNA (adenine1518-N6/adenine1519-N6)-dimethyltransferase
VDALKVVGNIPYNITTPILFHLLERPRPREILLMIQKEVGERILSPPGRSAYGALSVGVRSVARVERVLKVPASAFRPVPAVDSVVLRIRPLRPESLTPGEEGALRDLTRMAFQQRRKQFQAILRNHREAGLSKEEVKALEECTGFDLRGRPETFSPEDFITLSRALADR